MELSLTWPVKLFCEFIQDQWTTVLPAKSDSYVMFISKLSGIYGR